MLETRQLRVLRAVSMEGTVTGAAEKLGFSPSAVSQQLAALSRLIGQPIVRKEGRGIVLTPAGITLALRADEILAAVALAESEAKLSGDTTGVLKASTFSTAGRRLVVPAMTRMAETNPGLAVELTEAEPEDALPALQVGGVDLAVVYSYNLLPFEPPGVSLFPLVDEPMRFVGSAEIAERLTGSPSATVAVLRELPWIAGPTDTGDHEVIRRICGVLGFEPRIAHYAEDYSFTLALAAAGLGVSFIPVDAVEAMPQNVCALDLPGVTAVRHVSVATQHHHERRYGVATIMTALRDVVADALDRPSHHATLKVR